MTYNFKCTEHGLFDIELPMGSRSEELGSQPCPVCGCQANRVYHTPCVIFKGLGFYVTDTPDAKNSTLG